MKETLNSTKLHIATVIGFSLIAVVGIAVFVLCFAIVPLVVGIAAAAVAIAELVTKRFPLYAGIAVMAVLVFSLQIAGPIIPRGKESYVQQHTYLSALLRESVAHFPDSLPDSVEDYSLSYSSLFEANIANYTLQFRTDVDSAAQLSNIAEQTALTTINLTDFIEETDQYLRKLELIMGDNGSTLPLEIPDSITDPEGWRIHVQYSSFKDLYPRTGAVLVNVASGEVCYIRQG